MAQVKTAELRTLPEEELRQRLGDERKALMALRLKAHQGSVEQPHRMRQMRRTIARLNTLLRERRA